MSYSYSLIFVFTVQDLLNVLFPIQGGQKNLQTKADRTCEQVIVASLLAQYPKLTVIGEEKEPLDPSKDAKAGMNQEVLSKQCPPEYANVTEDQVR